VPPLFAYYGKPLDICRSALFSVLNAHFEQAITLTDDSVLELTASMLRSVKKDEYCINQAEVFWVKACHARGRMSRPNDPATGMPLTDDEFRRLMAQPTICRTGYSAAESGVIIRAQIDDDRWVQYPASLDLSQQRVEVGDGSLLR
jgi:hypothetical protein